MKTYHSNKYTHDGYPNPVAFHLIETKKGNLMEFAVDHRAVVIRGVRTLLLVALGLLLTWLASPAALGFFGKEAAPVVIPVAVSLVTMADKWVREKWKVKKAVAAARAAGTLPPK